MLALVEEACRRSALLWVELPGGRPRALWHAWEDGAAWVVLAGGEQEDPALAEHARAGLTCRVLCRSKDRGGRLVTWQAQAEVVASDDPGWDVGAAALLTARLNAPDGEAAAQRWRERATVVRLRPTGPVDVEHGHDDGGGAAPPPPSPATTRGPLPWVLGRRASSRRGRSRRRRAS